MLAFTYYGDDLHERSRDHAAGAPKGVIEPEHLRQGKRAKGHQDEIGQQRKQDQPGIASGSEI